MRLLGVGTYTNEYLYEYEDAAQRYGWEYKILGKGQKWTGFLNYQRWVLEELMSMPSDELVMITDTYDALVQRTPAEAETIFRTEFTAPIVVGAEAACTTGSTCYEPAPSICAPQNQPVMWPNTGCMVGEVQDLIELFEFAVAHHFNDDQRAAGVYWANNCHKLELDRDSKLVYNWAYGLEGDVKGNQIADPRTGHIPVVVHTFAQPFDLGIRSRKMRKVILGVDSMPLLGSLSEISHKMRTVVFECKDMQAYWVPFVVAICFILLIIIPLYIVVLKERAQRL